MLEIQPGTMVAALDQLLPPKVGFVTNLVNTITLGGSEPEQTGKLIPIRNAARKRKVPWWRRP